jgi:hypothetical protein
MNVAYEHEPALAVAAIVGLIVEIVFLAQFRTEHDGAADPMVKDNSALPIEPASKLLFR